MDVRWGCVIVLAACLSTDVVVCDGYVCPAGWVCGVEPNCIDGAAIAACAGHGALDACRYSAVADGECVDGICIERRCGNGVTSANEVCDDGNIEVGDGCSADCLSDETCGNAYLDAGEDCDDGSRNHDGCHSACVEETLQWEATAAGAVSPTLEVGAPFSRDGHAMAYDARRGRVVLFGGARVIDGVPVELQDTWEWDGSAWIELHADTAPSPRIHHAMVYDAARGRVVLFGGQKLGAGGFGDTWEWDGFQWIRKRPPTSPPARYAHQLTYDAARERVVMFGGLDRRDTWEWDGAQWTDVTPASSPPARIQHAMAYDAARERTVLFGGALSDNLDVVVADTWEWDGTEWLERIVAGPSPREEHTMAYDAVRGRVVLYAGRLANNSGANDTWEWEGTTWTQQADGPGARSEHAMTYHAGRGRVVVFSGDNTRDIHEWSGNGWSLQPEPQLPRARSGHTVVHDPTRGQVVMFGGVQSGVASQETWLWNGRGWSKSVAQSPPRRSDHAMAYDHTRRVIWLFGGDDAGVRHDDLWSWDGSRWTEVTVATKPSARAGHALAEDEVRNQIVMFGGHDGTDRDDTWTWNGTAWSNAPITTKPPARRDHAMAYDTKRQRIVMFGGLQGAGTTLADTWEWDGSTWMQRSTSTGPQARYGHVMAYDRIRERIVLHGGRIAGTGALDLDDAWDWDGMVWRPIGSSVAPDPRMQHAMAFDPQTAGLVIFGGMRSATDQRDTWLLRQSTLLPDETCNLGLDSDGDGLFACDDADCWKRCTPSCPPSWPCDPSAARCGDSTCDDVESCRSCSTDCGACMTVCGDFVCDPGESCRSDCH